jgi:hypothetical protein
MDPLDESIVDSALAEIRKEMNELADAVATGSGVADYAAYQKFIGVIHGLAVAERILLDLKEKAERA